MILNWALAGIHEPMQLLNAYTKYNSNKVKNQWIECLAMLSKQNKKTKSQLILVYQWVDGSIENSKWSINTNFEICARALISIFTLSLSWWFFFVHQKENDLNTIQLVHVKRFSIKNSKNAKNYTHKWCRLKIIYYHRSRGKTIFIQ